MHTTEGKLEKGCRRLKRKLRKRPAQLLETGLGSMLVFRFVCELFLAAIMQKNAMLTMEHVPFATWKHPERVLADAGVLPLVYPDELCVGSRPMFSPQYKYDM